MEYVLAKISMFGKRGVFASETAPALELWWQAAVCEAAALRGTSQVPIDEAAVEVGWRWASPRVPMTLGPSAVIHPHSSSSAVTGDLTVRGAALAPAERLKQSEPLSASPAWDSPPYPVQETLLGDIICVSRAVPAHYRQSAHGGGGIASGYD
jgi:hypothetical protein